MTWLLPFPKKLGPGGQAKKTKLLMLEQTIHDSFGEKTKVTVSPYSPMVKHGESFYAKALVIDIPENGKPELFPGLTRIQTG